MADPARVRKVADRVQETVARLLHGRIKDPRLGFVTVTDVRVTGDLQQATVFYTVYGSQEDQRGTAAALESAKGLIRSEVGRALGIRLTPSLIFKQDALPAAARTLEDTLVRARARDEQIAQAAQGAAYAGAADPYRRDVDADDADDSGDGGGGDGTGDVGDHHLPRAAGPGTAPDSGEQEAVPGQGGRATGTHGEADLTR